MFRILSRIERPLRSSLEWLSLGLMGSLALVVVAGVVFRKAGSALVWYDEVASILLVWLTYYGACLAALDRAHIGFPKLIEQLKGNSRLAVLIFRETVIVAFFVLVAWAGWRVLVVLEGTYLVSLPWVPTQLTQSVIPIGAVLFILSEACASASLFRSASSEDTDR